MSRKSFSAAASLGAWLALVGCGPTGYLYTPATTTLTSSEPAQSRTADHKFPPDSPHGDIRLVTSALEKPSADAPDAVLLRMIIHNRNQEPWIVDTREQKLVLATGGDERPTVTPTPLATLPALVAVPPGKTVTIDLSFVLPPGASKPTELPAFDAMWTVHVGARAITTTTRFEHLLPRRPVFPRG